MVVSLTVISQHWTITSVPCALQPLDTADHIIFEPSLDIRLLYEIETLHDVTNTIIRRWSCRSRITIRCRQPNQ